MKPRKGRGKLLKVREMNSDDRFVCEGYKQDGGIEMRKYISILVGVAVGLSYVFF